VPSLDEIFNSRKRTFFVQGEPKGLWHVESEEHCEYMLCGYFISVDAAKVKIQNNWGPRKCSDCWMLLERQRRTVFQ
jgi:hypothetical protein